MKKWMMLVIIVAIAASLTACGGGNNESSGNANVTEADAAGAKEVKVVASNWNFDADEYTITKGEPVKFVLENAEGYHTFEIKGAGIEVKPDSDKAYTFAEPGTYTIKCSTICGQGHSKMEAKLIVQ